MQYTNHSFDPDGLVQAETRTLPTAHPCRVEITCKVPYPVGCAHVYFRSAFQAVGDVELSDRLQQAASEAFKPRHVKRDAV